MAHILFYPIGNSEDSSNDGKKPMTNKPSPIISPKNTQVNDDEDQSITMSKADESQPGEIKYTVDGSSPTTKSTVYTDELSAHQLLEDSNDEDVTIKAVVDNDGDLSEEAVATVTKAKA